MATDTLTVKQQAFVDARLRGFNQREAYIEAGYSVSNMKSSTIDEEASKLAANPKVSTSIERARQANQAWNMERLLRECDTNLAGAQLDHQWSAANAIVNTAGKATQVLTDKVDINVTHTLKPGLTLEELEARVQRLDVLEAGVVEGESRLVDESATE